MELSALSRKHYTRLRWYFRAPDGAASLADNDDLDLAALGLIERKEYFGGAVFFRITQKGQQALAEENSREIERRSPHHELAHRLAEWLRSQGRITWENIELHIDLESGGRQSVRPDVFSLVTTLNPEKISPVVHEVKVSRADFLADIAKPEKRAGYAKIAEMVYYVAPAGIIHPSDVPPGCGLVLEHDAGNFEVVTKVKRAKAKLSDRQFMKLILKPGVCNPAPW